GAREHGGTTAAEVVEVAADDDVLLRQLRVAARQDAHHVPHRCLLGRDRDLHRGGEPEVLHAGRLERVRDSRGGQHRLAVVTAEAQGRGEKPPSPLGAVGGGGTGPTGDAAFDRRRVQDQDRGGALVAELL